MSGRTRKLPERIVGLLRSLVPPTNARAIDAVPSSYALPKKAVGSIHAAIDSTGTVAASLVPAELRALTRSRRRDLLGLAWVLTALSPEGRAAVIVPESFLTEATQGHLQLRRSLIEQGRLHGVIRLAAGCYKARSGAAIVLLGPAETGSVWFCDVLEASALEPELGAAEPQCVVRWRERDATEVERARTEASFVVPRAEIVAAQFDLSIACYRAAGSTGAVPLRRPQEILAELAGMEAEIFQSLRDLVGMLKT